MIIAINSTIIKKKKIKTNKSKTLKRIQIFNRRTSTKLVSVIIMIIKKQY